jgi:hypothetical protein
MPTIHLEPRLTEAAFRRYEPFITAAVAAWPNETSTTTDSNIISPLTYVARCRDALASYRRFQWPSTIDAAKFISIDGMFRVSLDPDGTIWFRRRGNQGRPEGKVVNTTPTSQTSTNAVRGALGPYSPAQLTVEILQSFCVLLSAKLLTTPVIISGSLSDDVVTQLEAQYDVALNYDPVRNETILL